MYGAVVPLIPLSNWPDFHRMHPDASDDTMNGTEEKKPIE